MTGTQVILLLIFFQTTGLLQKMGSFWGWALVFYIGAVMSKALIEVIREY